jgi:hypothetical protein
MEFLGFAISDCTVQLSESSARYLRAVHRTALELAVQNQFGAEVGGFWLLQAQIEQLRRLPECYSTQEAPLVQLAIEAYLEAQLEGISILKLRQKTNGDKECPKFPAF